MIRSTFFSSRLYHVGLTVMFFLPLVGKTQISLNEDNPFYLLILKENKIVDTLDLSFTSRNDFVVFNNLIYHGYWVSLVTDRELGFCTYALDQNDKLKKIDGAIYEFPAVINPSLINLKFKNGFLIFYYSLDPDLESSAYEIKVDLFELNQDTFKKYLKTFISGLLLKVIEEL